MNLVRKRGILGFKGINPGFPYVGGVGRFWEAGSYSQETAH
jgi:hypothetical protein